MAHQGPYTANIDDVELVPGLRRDEGWVDMKVQFLVDAAKAGAEEIVFGRTVFTPGARHEFHRHANAEEVQMLVSGEGYVLDGDDAYPMRPGDVVFTPKNRWHGFRNSSETEDAILIWCWAGAGSREAAGYEARGQ